MPIYTVDLACRAVGHDYSALFDALRAAKAQPLLENRWLLDVSEDLDVVTKALLSHCVDGDGLFVTRIDPETQWTGTGLGDAAKSWLLSRMTNKSARSVAPDLPAATNLN